MKLLEPQAFNTLDKLKNISFVLILLVGYVWLVTTIINYILKVPNFSFGKPPLNVVLFYAVFCAPLWEELAFRVIPIKLANLLGQDFVLPIIGLSSLIFGLGHGMGSISLIIQGAMGFVFSVLYIKNNYCYWSVVITHALWNLGVYLL